MEKKSHTFLHALKLWLIWNVLVYLSLMVFLICLWITLGVGQLTGYAPDNTYASDWVIYSIILFGLVLGSVLMGRIQWIAFRNRIEHAYGWILATALGWSLVMVLLYLSPFYIPEWGDNLEPYIIVVAFIVGAIVGAVIGLPQWLVLRGKVLGAELWLEASILGWACAGCAVYALLEIVENMGGAGFFLFPLIAVGLLPMVMITGVAYAYLFTQPSPKNEELKNEQYHTRSATVGQ